MIKAKSPPPPGSSYSTEYLLQRQNAPQVSALMTQGISQYRKGQLSDEVDQGLYREGSGSSSGGYLGYGHTPASVVVGSSSGIRKNAQVLSSSFGPGMPGVGGSGGTAKQIPEIYSPLWLASNLNLPRDRATINAWCRAFFALNPFVHNAINLHSTYPISKLNIKCANKKVEHFFNDMIEETNLMNICVQIAMEFWLLGEAFVYAELDQHKGKWSRLLMQNPDYMVVKRTVVADEPVIMLRPDQNLHNIVNSNKPSDVAQRKQLNQYIIDAVRRGENIPMNNFNISHISRKISPYEIRGTGLPVCIFRQLMLFDKMRESQFAQADNMINPLTLVKVGSEGLDGLHPSHGDLEAYREIFESLQYDKDAKIFTHPGVTVERVGYGQGIYDVNPTITQLIKEIWIGLMVPSSLMDGGQDTTYANAGVALDVLRQRYMQFRNMMALWLKRKIFAPIAEIQGFWEYKEGGAGRSSEKQLIIPEVDWNHMSLFDAGDYTTNLITLTTSGGAESPARASLHTLYRSLGLEWEDEQRKMRKEAIQAAILQKEKAALETLSLNELRALSDDEEIPAPEVSQEAPLPGEVGGGGAAPLNLPGMDMSGAGAAPPSSGAPPSPPATPPSGPAAPTGPSPAKP